MFSAIIYLELFIALFFLPGFFITLILGIKKFRFLLSFALSYSLLVLTLLPFEYYAQPIVRWQWCVLLEWVILAASALAKTFMNGNFKNVLFVVRSDRFVIPAKAGIQEKELLDSHLHGNDRRDQLPNVLLSNLIRRLLSLRLLVPLVLAAIICGYLAYAGIYLEIPSDVWTHAYRFQWHKSSIISNGVFPSDLSWDSLFLHNTSNFWHFNPWYFIHAWLCNISGLSIMDSLQALTFVNVLTFLLGFYFFGLFLFAGLRVSAFKKMMMAAFASLFAAASMGNMVFAYIRYYAFAPAILNYVLFLAAMAIIIAWLRSNRWLGHALWIAPVLIIVTNVVHTQEALFIFFMTLALSIVKIIRIFWRKVMYGNFSPQADPPTEDKVVGAPLVGDRSEDGRAQARPLHLFSMAGQFVYGSHCSVREWKSVILSICLLIVFFIGFATIRYFNPGAWISANMIMPHVGIPSEPVSFIFNKLLISPPHNPWLRLVVYQLFVFYQVIGLWGLLVYLLFLLMIRHFIKIPYLIAGLVIVPFLTAFNPLTVDMMARMGQDVTIYRFHYLIPLPFIGGYLFVHFFGKTREWFQKMHVTPVKSVTPIWPRLSWLNFAGCILVLAGLIGFVFPINAAGIYAPYSKIYTLRKIPAGNDYHLCDDLGKIMAKYENKVVLTDPWTTRFLWCYSPKNTYHVPWVSSSNPEKEPPEPYTWKKIRNRGLIVINRRNGVPSITGRIAKHWPEDVLMVSRYYSLEVQHYLESHPEKFQKVWSQNRIAVYAVR